MIKVTNKVTTYEEDSAEKEIAIESHWCLSAMVVIVIGDKKVIVKGSELKVAIDNAMNKGR